VALSPLAKRLSHGNGKVGRPASRVSLLPVDGDTVSVERVINAPAAEIFALLATPESMLSWTVPAP
jgi:hypothetical protein